MQFIVVGDLGIAIHPNQAYKNITGTLSPRCVPESRTAFLGEAIPAVRKAIGGVSIMCSFRLRGAGINVVKAAHANVCTENLGLRYE